MGETISSLNVSQRRKVKDEMQLQPAVPNCWTRESDLALRKLTEEKLFQISRMAPGDKEPLVIATCGKASAQRLISALATQDGPARYQITAVFVNMVLPGVQPLGQER